MIHIVLYEPEIPQNTGNIMRTCMAFQMKLHLIEPLGFYMDEKHLRRAGMDYMKDMDYRIYKNWDAFLEENKGSMYFMTRYGHRPPSSFDFAGDQSENIYLVLGRESTGIPLDILRRYPERCMRIPMDASARSLNLSNCAAIGAYEILRQKNYPGLAGEEVIKGSDWLENGSIIMDK